MHHADISRIMSKFAVEFIAIGTAPLRPRLIKILRAPGRFWASDFRELRMEFH